MQTHDIVFAGQPSPVFVCEDLDDVVEYTSWVHFCTTHGFTVLGLDVETTGLDPWSEDFRVTLVQISNGERTYVVPTHVTGAHEALIGTLENPKVKVATHSQYDAVALATLGIVLGPKVIDTYVLSRLLAPGNDTPHGLKPLCTEWLQAPELEQADVERAAYFKAEAKVHAPKEIARAPRKVESWGWKHLSPMSPEVLRYAGMDALAVRLLAPVLTDALIKQGVPETLIEQELWLASVATAAVASCSSRPATWSISPGGRNGSSPCTFTTTVSSLQPRAAATAATRSVPDGKAGSVMTAIDRSG